MKHACPVAATEAISGEPRGIFDSLLWLQLYPRSARKVRASALMLAHDNLPIYEYISWFWGLGSVLGLTLLPCRHGQTLCLETGKPISSTRWIHFVIYLLVVDVPTRQPREGGKKKQKKKKIGLGVMKQAHEQARSQ